MRILAAAKSALLDAGYAKLATRGIAEAAGVPLSQIHYHFGSKQKLVLAVLDMENQQRLARQAAMYQSNLPLWKQWQQACDFFDEDLDSGYVRVLMEMTAAGWSNQEIADAVSAEIQGWFDLLAAVAQRAAERVGSLGPVNPAGGGRAGGPAVPGSRSGDPARPGRIQDRGAPGAAQDR